MPLLITGDTIKKLIIAFAVIALAAFVSGQQTVEDVHELMLEQLSPYLGRSLGAAGRLYGNEDVNFYLMDGTLIGYVRTSGGKFEKFGRGRVKEPTMEVYIESVGVIKEISETPRKIDKFYRLKKAGKIRIKPIGFPKKTKYVFANSLGHIANIFV